MLIHFQYQSMYPSKQLPGWTFSFYFQKQLFTGNYHQNGNIEWTSVAPEQAEEARLKEQIHELMLLHVYE